MSKVEVLSQEEINQLLTAINAGEDNDDIRPAYDTRKIKIYDFRRPDKFSKDHLRTFSILHDKFSRSFSLYLNKIGIPYTIKVVSIDQLTYDEFIRSSPEMSQFLLLDMRGNKALKGKSIFQISNDSILSMIGQLLGSKYKIKDPKKDRNKYKLTKIEEAIFKKIFCHVFTNELGDSWSEVMEFTPYIERNIEYSELRMFTPSDMGLSITFEMQIDNREEFLNYFIPYSSIEKALPILTSKNWFHKYEVRPTPIRNLNLSELKLELSVNLKLCREFVTLGYLKNLGIRDRIELSSGQYCSLMLEDYHLFDANFVGVECKGKYTKISIDKKINKIGKNFMKDKLNVTPSVSLNDVAVQLSVELGRTKKSIKDILQIGEGTIVELDSLAGEPVNIFANNVLIAKGEVVVIDENFGVRIVEILYSGQDNVVQ